MRKRGRSWIVGASDPRDQVDAEEIAPDLACCVRRRGHDLEEPHVALRESVLPVRLDAVDRVGGGLAVQLDHRGVLRARAVAPVLRVREPVVLPPGFGSGQEAGDVASHAFVHLRTEDARLFGVHDPRRACRAGIVAKREARAVGVELEVGCCDPVAEATVDRRLRGPEDRERLTAPAEVVELVAHQARENAAATVAREHSDPRHSTRAELTSGHRQPERERRRGPDGLPVDVCGEEALAREHLAVPLEVVVTVLLREDGHRGAHRAVQLVFRRATDLDLHGARAYEMRSRGA